MFILETRKLRHRQTKQQAPSYTARNFERRNLQTCDLALVAFIITPVAVHGVGQVVHGLQGEGNRCEFVFLKAYCVLGPFLRRSTGLLDTRF